MVLMGSRSQVTTVSDSFYQQHFNDSSHTDCTRLLKIEGAGGHAIAYEGYFVASVDMDGATTVEAIKVAG